MCGCVGGWEGGRLGSGNTRKPKGQGPMKKDLVRPITPWDGKRRDKDLRYGIHWTARGNQIYPTGHQNLVATLVASWPEPSLLFSTRVFGVSKLPGHFLRLLERLGYQCLLDTCPNQRFIINFIRNIPQTDTSSLRLRPLRSHAKLT